MNTYTQTVTVIADRDHAYYRFVDLASRNPQFDRLAILTPEDLHEIAWLALDQAVTEEPLGLTLTLRMTKDGEMGPLPVEVTAAIGFHHGIESVLLIDETNNRIHIAPVADIVRAASTFNI